MAEEAQYTWRSATVEGADLQGRGFTGSELGIYLFQEAENVGPSCALDFQYAPLSPLKNGRQFCPKKNILLILTFKEMNGFLVITRSLYDIGTLE